MVISGSRLVMVLKTLSRKEWRGFGAFVLKETGNSSEETRLWNLLDSAYPKFTNDRTDRSVVLETLYGKRETDDRKLRRCMNRMTELVNRFLVQVENQSDPIGMQLQLLSQFTKRELVKHHGSLAGKLTVKLNELPKNLTWYLHDYSIDRESEKLLENHSGRVSNSNMETLSEKLDVFFMVSKLKQACAAYTRQRLFREQHDLGLLQPILRHLRQNPPSEPLLQLYLACVLMMQNERDPKHYALLKQLLESRTENVSTKDIQDLHVIAQNHCIRAINLGDPTYVPELFSLYKLGLKKHVVQRDPTNFAPAFKNIVSVAVKLEAYDWAEQFINENARLLGSKYERDYLRYNLAQLNFARGQFLDCRALIHGERFKDPFIKLNVRILLLKTYYELDQLDNVEAELENFKQFLHRNKQLSYHRKNCQNLMTFLKRTLYLKPGDEIGMKRLKDQVSVAKQLSERKWLIEKLLER